MKYIIAFKNHTYVYNCTLQLQFYIHLKIKKKYIYNIFIQNNYVVKISLYKFYKNIKLILKITYYVSAFLSKKNQTVFIPQNSIKYRERKKYLIYFDFQNTFQNTEFFDTYYTYIILIHILYIHIYVYVYVFCVINFQNFNP